MGVEIGITPKWVKDGGGRSQGFFGDAGKLSQIKQGKALFFLQKFRQTSNVMSG
jgi:hypothetical protein